MTHKIEFINGANCTAHLGKIESWLHQDFIQNHEPHNHFWHNMNSIAEAFREHRALVAIGNRKAVLGYLIWRIETYSPGKGEIEFVHIQKKHRKKGIFKEMLAAFCAQFPEVWVLSANVLQASRPIFDKLNWQTTNTIPIANEISGFSMPTQNQQT